MADDRETRLDRACADYLRAADAGRPPDRAAWLSEYHDLAAELSEFLAGFGAVERVFAPLRDDRDATVARTEPADPDAPTTPDGYELLGPIAAGGMGVVYRARQVAVNRIVALKMIRAGALAGESAVQRFRLEAEAAAGFSHPHIVPVYEVGVTAGGQPFFSMKLIDGQTLADWLTDAWNSGRLSTGAGLREAVRLLSAVCRAVHYAHQRGFLHRDLKPANVLVDAAGVPHVTDFGLAKRIGERPTDGQLTEAGGLVGTLAYMAPEQARGGERLTTAADVYSLGAILFLVLTGGPLRPDPVSELMAGTLGRTPPAFPRTADRDLAAICSKCLTEQPTTRYGSAEAVADELDRWADGRPIRTRPPRLTRRVWLWVRRRPRSAALVALAAGLLAVGVGLVTWKWRDEAAARREAQVEGARSAVAVARSLMEPEADGDSRDLGTAALWWVRAFEQAPADERELRDTARANLAALSGRLHVLRAVRVGAPLPPVSGPVNADGPDGWRAEANGHLVRVSKGGRPVGEPLAHDDVVRAVGFFHDGRLLTGGDEHDARVWRYTEPGGWKEEARLEHQEYVRAVAFSPDGRLVATGGADGAAQVWDTATFRRLGQLLPHVGWVERVAFSPDGRDLTTTTADGVVRVWGLSAAATGDRSCALGSAVYAVAPSSDGGAVYAGTEGGLYRVDATAPDWQSEQLHKRITWAVAVHPRGEWVAAGGPVGQKGWFGVFRPNGELVGRIESLPQPVRSAAVSPDGSRVLFTTATTLNGGLWEWQAATPDAPPRPLDQGQPTWAAVLTPGGGRYATSVGDGLIRTHPTGATITHPPRAVALAVHPDGRRLAAGSTDGFVRVWHTESGQQMWEEEHRGAVWAVAVGPDGKLVASGGRDRCVRLWEADTGRAVGPPLEHKAVVWAVAFSPDGKWVWSGSEDGTVRRRLAPSATLDVPDDRLRRWAERGTGLTLAKETPRPLTPDEWSGR